MTKTTHSNFRMQSYRMPDGTTEEVFGGCAAPVDGILVGDVTIDQTTIRTNNIIEAGVTPPPVKAP